MAILSHNPGYGLIKREGRREVENREENERGKKWERKENEKGRKMKEEKKWGGKKMKEESNG